MQPNSDLFSRAQVHGIGNGSDARALGITFTFQDAVEIEILGAGTQIWLVPSSADDHLLQACQSRAIERVGSCGLHGSSLRPDAVL